MHIFCPKICKWWASEQFAQKNKRLAYLLIFGEPPDPFAHNLSFVMSDLSDSFTSLFKKEGMWELLIFFKLTQKFNSIFSCKLLVFASNRAIKLIKNKWFAFLLFYHEQLKKIAHRCSFVMSNLSDLLTVGHLSWATWAISIAKNGKERRDRPVLL